jgi:hypothetical protein
VRAQKVHIYEGRPQAQVSQCVRLANDSQIQLIRASAAVGKGIGKDAPRHASTVYQYQSPPSLPNEALDLRRAYWFPAELLIRKDTQMKRVKRSTYPGRLKHIRIAIWKENGSRKSDL